MNIKQIRLIGIPLFVIFLLLIPSSLAATGFYKTAPLNGFTGSLYFTGTSSAPGNVYKDTAPANPDVGIEICSVGTTNVGGFYVLKTPGQIYSALVTYGDPDTLQPTTLDLGGGCYATDPGFLTVSPSKLGTASPTVYRAALPGNLWIGYDSSSTNPAVVNNFMYAGTNAKLLGYYLLSRDFDYVTSTVDLASPTIYLQTTSSSFQKAANDASFGISDERPMVIGVCSDDHGESCSGGTRLTSAGFPLNYDAGLGASPIDDQHIYTRYAVVNGLGYPMCIGANLGVTINNIQPDPIYYSQTLSIEVIIDNQKIIPSGQTDIGGGNVPVTTDFTLKLRIYQLGNASNVVLDAAPILITSDLSVDGTLNYGLNWNAIAHSGFYVAEVTIDYGDDVVECNEADNVASRSFELKPITLPTLYIDGVQRDSFPIANVPYNLTIHLENSDGDILNAANGTVRERNGLALPAPTQLFNITINSSGAQELSGVMTKTDVNFVTDYYGNSSFVFIPAYNRLYEPEYNYLDVVNHIGNYNLTLLGTQSNGESFKFVKAGTLYSEYALDINDTSYMGTYNFKELRNENIVSQVLDFIYQTYSIFLNSITT